MQLPHDHFPLPTCHGSAWMAYPEAGALSLPGLVRSAGWIPARLCAEGIRDSELRPHLMAQLAVPASPQQLLTHTRGSGKDSGGGRPGPGLLPGSLGQRLGAAVWVRGARLWRRLLVLGSRSQEVGHN